MTQKTLKLDLSELIPQEVEFELSGRKDAKLHLCPFTLRVQAWAIKRFGKDGLEAAIQSESLTELAEIGYFQLKEKSLFKSLDEFMDAVIDFKDRGNLVKAVLGSIGLSQPILEKLIGQLDAGEKGNESGPAQTGPNSSTT